MKFRERYRYDPQIDKLGSGGFATVYKAFDILLEREVALKIFHSSETQKVTLLSELRRMSMLDQPNLIRCLDIITTDITNVHGQTEQLNIGVMEYANKGSLKDFIHSNKDNETRKKVLIQILQGISYLHSKDIIHRDLKPQNILLSEKDGILIPKITDFGISKSLTNDGLSSSVVMGTIEYMAPEQFNPQKYGINGRISTNLDLWGFGIIVYEMITKRHLFGAEDKNSSSEQVMTEILSLKLPADVDNIPEPYRSVIKKCLVANANQRVKDANELITFLRSPNYESKENEKLISGENTRVFNKKKEVIENRKTPFESHSKQEVVNENFSKIKSEIKKKRKYGLAIGVPALIILIATFIFFGARGSRSKQIVNEFIKKDSLATDVYFTLTDKTDTITSLVFNQAYPISIDQNADYLFKGEELVIKISNGNLADQDGNLSKGIKSVTFLGNNIPVNNGEAVFKQIVTAAGMHKIDISVVIVDYKNNEKTIKLQSEYTVTYQPNSGNTKQEVNKHNSRRWFTGNFYILQSEAGSYGFILNSGQVLVAPEYQSVRNFNGLLFIVESNGKFGLINPRTRREILPLKYDDIWGFNGSFSQVKLNGKYGLIGLDGRLITDIKYDTIEVIDNTKAKVSLNGEFFYIDKMGSRIP